MSTNQGKSSDIDAYLVTHVATTCDEHGVYVTKDSAEVIEIGWLLLDAKSLEEVSCYRRQVRVSTCLPAGFPRRSIARASSSSP